MHGSEWGTQWRPHLGLGLQQTQDHCAHRVCTLKLELCRQQHLVHLQHQHLQTVGGGEGSEGAGPSQVPHRHRPHQALVPLGTGRLEWLAGL